MRAHLNERVTHLSDKASEIALVRGGGGFAFSEMILFFMLLASYVYFLPRWADWSQDSRLDLTLAIVDQHTLSIDDYYENTGDYALYNGRHYLDKAPGPSLMAVPLYAVVKPILRSAPVGNLLHKLAQQPAFESTLREGGTGLMEVKIYRAVVLFVLTFLLVALPSAVLGVLLYRVLAVFGLSPSWRGVIVLTYGLATNAFTYSGAFYSHQISAFLLFGALYLAMKPNSRRKSLLRPYLVGLMIGLAMISEYPTAMIGAAIFTFTMIEKPTWPERFAVIVGGLGPGILLGAYDWAIFGTILPVGYEYSALYQDLHSVGLISLTYPHGDALWGITFGSFRGLFYVAPVLLIALLGLIVWWRSAESQRLFWVSASSCLSFFVFNSSSAMWQGGYAVGPRYLVPMLPFMMLGMGAFLRRYGDSPVTRWVFGFLAAYSFAVVWIETVSGQGYPDWTLNPLFNYSLPRFVSGNIARNLGMLIKLHGLASLIPIGLLLGAGGLMLFSGIRYRLSGVRSIIPWGARSLGLQE